MSEYKEKKVGMSETTYNQLKAISKARRIDESFCYRGKDIIAKLVADLHKKECK